jgi:hypothetical protein
VCEISLGELKKKALAIVIGKNCLRVLRDKETRFRGRFREKESVFGSSQKKRCLSLVVLLTLFRASSEVFKEKNLFVVAGEWSESEIIL